jgi:hypothetical protein
MNDETLDLLLENARVDASPGAVELGRLLAREATQDRASATAGRRWRRAGFVVPVGIGAIVMMGAGTYGAYQLSIPPFVETEPGVERVTQAIELDYTTDAGTVLDCNLYLEFRDLTDGQRDALNQLSKDSGWVGFGQRAYDALPAKNRETQNGPEELWSSRVSQAAYDAAVARVPGLTYEGRVGEPSIVGSTTRCEYPDGQR